MAVGEERMLDRPAETAEATVAAGEPPDRRRPQDSTGVRPTVVELVSVTKVYTAGADPAVSELDLTVYEGEFFSLLGPSGSGKTTTLRMIAGFERPTIGRVRLGGGDVTMRPPYKRDVSTVFQNYALFP